MAFFSWNRKKPREPTRLTPEIIAADEHVTVLVPGVHPQWPVMGAGEDYVSVNGWGCLTPDIYAQKHGLIVWGLGIVAPVFAFAALASLGTGAPGLVLALPCLFVAFVAGKMLWQSWHGDHLYEFIRSRWGVPVQVFLRPDGIEFGGECVDRNRIERRTGARLVASMRPLDQATRERDLMQVAKTKGQ